MRAYGKIYIQILVMFILMESALKVTCRFEFTNLQCKNLNDSLLKVNACLIKSVNRTYKHASVKLSLLKSTTHISGRAVFLKRLNGFKPFLYNFTINACKFMKHYGTPSADKVITFFFNLCAPFSNINHTCPYADIIVDKVPASHLDHQLSKILPLPEGDYRIHTSWKLRTAEAIEIIIDFKKD